MPTKSNKRNIFLKKLGECSPNITKRDKKGKNEKRKRMKKWELTHG